MFPFDDVIMWQNETMTNEMDVLIHRGLKEIGAFEDIFKRIFLNFVAEK